MIRHDIFVGELKTSAKKIVLIQVQSTVYKKPLIKITKQCNEIMIITYACFSKCIKNIVAKKNNYEYDICMRKTNTGER